MGIVIPLLFAFLFLHTTEGADYYFSKMEKVNVTCKSPECLFHCYAVGSCEGNFVCPHGSHCTWICDNIACQYINISCEENAKCDFKCYGRGSCRKINILNSDSSKCNLNCTGESSCKDNNITRCGMIDKSDYELDVLGFKIKYQTGFAFLEIFCYDWIRSNNLTLDNVRVAFNGDVQILTNSSSLITQEMFDQSRQLLIDTMAARNLIIDLNNTNVQLKKDPYLVTLKIGWSFWQKMFEAVMPKMTAPFNIAPSNVSVHDENDYVTVRSIFAKLDDSVGSKIFETVAPLFTKELFIKAFQTDNDSVLVSINSDSSNIYANVSMYIGCEMPQPFFKCGCTKKGWLPPVEEKITYVNSPDLFASSTPIVPTGSININSRVNILSGDVFVKESLILSERSDVIIEDSEILVGSLVTDGSLTLKSNLKITAQKTVISGNLNLTGSDLNTNEYYLWDSEEYTGNFDSVTINNTVVECNRVKQRGKTLILVTGCDNVVTQIVLPVVLSIVGIVIVGVLLVFAIPHLKKVFISNEGGYRNMNSYKVRGDYE